MMWTFNSLLTLNIIQNLKDVSTFMNLLQTSARQVMIKRLAANGGDKDAWRKAEDYISSVLGPVSLARYPATSMSPQC